MGLVDKIIERFGERLSFELLGEIRGLRQAVEDLTLAYRQVHHLPTGLSTVEALPRTPTGKVIAVAEAESEPDWLRVDLIESLAREHHIPFDGDTDLLALAREHGWVNDAGEMIMLPSDYA